MTYEQQIREARSPKDALLIIARALDGVLGAAPVQADPWGVWEEEYEEPPEPNPALQEAAGRPRRVVQITGDTEHTDVHIPAPNMGKQLARAAFERNHLHLTEHLGEGGWSDAYAKGGPMWLYLGNRDLVMSFPGHLKQQMIMDVEEDSPKDAHEMARDILKADCETGPGGMGMRMAEGSIG